MIVRAVDVNDVAGDFPKGFLQQGQLHRGFSKAEASLAKVVTFPPAMGCISFEFNGRPCGVYDGEDGCSQRRDACAQGGKGTGRKEDRRSPTPEDLSFGGG